MRRSTSFDPETPTLPRGNQTGTQDSMLIMAVDGERKASTDQTKVYHLNVASGDKESQNASMKNSYAFGQGTFQ